MFSISPKMIKKDRNISKLGKIVCRDKGKGKVHPRTGQESPEEEMYSSTLPSTSALDGGGWSTSRPGRCTPGTRYPLYRMLGGPQGWSGRVQKTSPPNGFRSLDRPTRSESLYRLSYPGLEKLCVTNIIVTLVHLSVLFCEWSSLSSAQLILYKISVITN